MCGKSEFFNKREGQGLFFKYFRHKLLNLMEKYSPAMPIGTTDQKIFEFLQLPEAFRGGKTNK